MKLKIGDQVRIVPKSNERTDSLDSATIHMQESFEEIYLTSLPSSTIYIIEGMVYSGFAKLIPLKGNYTTSAMSNNVELHHLVFVHRHLLRRRRA